MLGSSITKALAAFAVVATTAGLTSTAALAATRAPATPPTGTWNELFFPKSTTFGGTGGLSTGPEQWSWSYRTAADNCGHAEVWTDASNNDGGQETAADGGTDITAPAPGATCPA